jgi:nitric oxide reductase subunit C|tara:strand:- start:1308 stop:1721 length:414 start_codon:yes stop_codon:yes gene_type:complete
VISYFFYSIYIFASGTDSLPGMIAHSDESRHGQELFQEYHCIACHQFYGLGGHMGPELTNAMSYRGGNVGEIIARQFLANGGNGMPNLNLTETEISALIAYLKFVDKTGTYPPKNYKVKWGMIYQEDDPEWVSGEKL